MVFVWSRAKEKKLTNCSRGIRNAWHFHYAFVLVFRGDAAASVLRCSPLNRALVANEENAAKTECSGLMPVYFWLGLRISIFSYLGL